jgi:S1-C subfamily serine protease
MKKLKLRKILLILAVVFFLLVTILGGAIADRIFVFRPLDKFFPRKGGTLQVNRVLTEESAVIDVAEEVSPSVVTVSMQTSPQRILQFNPFSGFTSSIQGGQPQDIGSGFIVSKDGLIVTNKHVVSEVNAQYKVITKDDKEYEVKKVSRDPANDIAILKIDPSAGFHSDDASSERAGQELKPVEIGDSTNLKVGQFVIAIGTALGEFRHTVTTGVISGLGRGITTGSPFEGYAEKLDDIIQTDAAINPGNSGGPLLNSAGQVIGVNVAVAQGANNIGFALPVNIVKEALREFTANGGFSQKAYLGVEYQMITQANAILNNVPQGAYVVQVVTGSPAEKAGIKHGDIITKIDGEEINEKGGGLSKVISKKKGGDKIEVEIWRAGEIKKLQVTLSESNQ